MPQIRIKKSPQMGDQRDYSLFDRRTMNPGPTDTSEDVQNTMGPVPRDQASIEVERGEVVIGDTNQDGFLELFTFTGKPHSKGGTPVDIPVGSFIYSNTRKLRIKDPEVLTKIFGMSASKQGYTPAEIAKKYQINQYVADLKDESADNITKRSADQMLKNNINKLGMLALIQESMKGFPDGIPAIAESAAIGMGMDPQMMQQAQGQQQQGPPQGPPQGPESMQDPQMMQDPSMMEDPQMQMARYGGLRKYQVAGGVNDFGKYIREPKAKNLPPRWYDNSFSLDSEPVERPQGGWPIPAADPNVIFYKNDFEPVTVVEANPESVAGNSFSDPFTSPYIKLSDGTKISQAEYMYLMGTGSNRYKAAGTKVRGFGAIDLNNPYEQKIAGAVNSFLNSSEHPVITRNPVIRKRAIPDQYGNPTSLNLSTGDNLHWQGKDWVVVNPYGEHSDRYLGSYKESRDMFDNTNGIILVRNKETGEYDYIEGEDLGDTWKIAPGNIMVTPGQHLPAAPKTPPPPPDFTGTSAAAMAGNYAPGSTPLNDGTTNNGNTNGQPNHTSLGLSLDDAALTMGWGSAKEYENSGWKLNEAARNQLLQNAQAMGWGNDIIGYKNSGYVYGPNAAKTQQAPAKTATKTTSSAKPAAKPAGRPKTAADALNALRDGGSMLPKYQPGSVVTPGGPGSNNSALTSTGTATQVASQVNAAPDASGERFLKQVETDEGIIYVYINPTTKQVIGKNDKGEVKSQRALTSEELATYTGKHSQYGSAAIQDVLQKNPQTRYTYTNFGSFGSQPRLGQTGIYLSSGNAKSHAEGDLSAEEWKDFNDRHGDWIDQNYTGGFAQFQKDLKTSPEAGAKAAAWFQDQVNGYTQKEYGLNYFSPTKSDDNPYTRDSKFGQVTYSVPRFFNQPKETPKKVPDPKQLQAFYCVEQADGSRSVQTVTYKEGEQPTSPTGSKVTPYSSRAEADAGCIAEQQLLAQEPKKSIPWYAPDIINFTGAMTDKGYSFEPMLQQLDLMTPGYDTENYDTMVNNARGQQRETQTQFENTLSGPVAAAASAGISNFDGIAGAIAGVQARNVNTVNTAAGNINGIENQEAMANAGFRDKYMNYLATQGQQEANSDQQRKWRRIGAMNNGIKNNWYHKKMEGVLFPQVHDDSITGDISFSGNGRNIFGPDVYQNPVSGASNAAAQKGVVSNAAMDAYNTAYEAAINRNLKPEIAEKMAMAEYSRIYNIGTPSANMRQQYMNAMLGNGMGFGAQAATSPYDFD